MSSPAIRIENLSKQFHLGGLVSKYDYRTFREALADVALAPLRRLQGKGSTAPPEILWALRDVTFDVQHGETIGIIGRNGAGKSTLLKVLSRITEPTRGRIEIHGRVASLLEVGTGFHPELTGRENIFLNGAIMGMARREIAQKFDEIVAFAEMERFIDTPVKRFSSGLYLRLAFAVAAHLEPEILVVDEVLAVGDLSFQKKCLGKMEAVASQGRTVLFVSHNMPVMRQICHRGVLLQAGRVEKIGPINDVVDYYVNDAEMQAELVFAERPDAVAQFTRFRLRNSHGAITCRVPQSEPFVTEIEWVVRETISADRLWWGLFRGDGEWLVNSNELDSPTGLHETRKPGTYVTRVHFPGGLLNAGSYQYRVSLATGSGVVRDNREGAYFEIYDDTDLSLNSGGSRPGALLMRLQWSEKKVD